MCTDTLTGKSRFRAKKQMLGKPLIVLQVEVHRKGYVWNNDPMGDMDHLDFTYWRDAELEDLTIIEGGNK